MNTDFLPPLSAVVAEMTGQTHAHLVACHSRDPRAVPLGQVTQGRKDEQGDTRVHREVLAPLQRLRDKARAAGFELAIASSFRNFDRQQRIWREKAAGQRPVFGADGEPLLPEALSDDELLWAILRWSALPGTSRHHWGTDLDVYDASAVDADYRLQLVPEEYQPRGPFGPFRHWLERLIVDGDAEGFYHPYAHDRGAVAPEPWHISYRPVAQYYQSLLSFEVFEQLLHSGAWPLTETIAIHAEDIYRRFVQLQFP
jgi:LAS superfamily LD-carboxypeptidase LdcB